MKYKKGSKIFTTKNSVWGRIPLTVDEDLGYSVYTKENKRFPGGYFLKKEIEPYTIDRAKKLEKLSKLEEKLEKEKEKLFGKAV